jgi:hypothetical protein
MVLTAELEMSSIFCVVTVSYRVELLASQSFVASQNRSAVFNFSRAWVLTKVDHFYTAKHVSVLVAAAVGEEHDHYQQVHHPGYALHVDADCINCMLQYNNDIVLLTLQGQSHFCGWSSIDCFCCYHTQCSQGYLHVQREVRLVTKKASLGDSTTSGR